MGTVEEVIDGSTMRVRLAERSVLVKFRHVECPGPGQAFSDEAKQYTTNLCLGKKILLDTGGTSSAVEESNAPLIADVRFFDRGNPEAMILQRGLGWYKETTQDADDSLRAVESSARNIHAGMWSVAPSDSARSPQSPGSMQARERGGVEANVVAHADVAPPGGEHQQQMSSPLVGGVEQKAMLNSTSSQNAQPLKG
ncbi:MAG TPA: thermonuclease family protein, partial [Chroococcales cyanobacterium]